ncbi:hypothetical protein M378DRAFT_173873, partial [Amanita muscaria Koide BX008]
RRLPVIFPWMSHRLGSRSGTVNDLSTTKERKNVGKIYGSVGPPSVPALWSVGRESSYVKQLIEDI